MTFNGSRIEMGLKELVAGWVQHADDAESGRCDHSRKYAQGLRDCASELISTFELE